jgi:hypothetical protein
MLNYYPIPTKSMEIPICVRITTAPPVPILSTSFFINIPNIIAQFNIPHVAKQYNVSSTEMSKLVKNNESYGVLSEIVSQTFVAERAKLGKITNAFFTRVEVLSICNLLQPIQNGTSNNNIMYIGDDFATFTGVIAYMIPRRTIIFTPVTPAQLREPRGLEHVVSQSTTKKCSLIYVDVCAPEIVYSHTYIVFLLKALAIILSSQARCGSVVIKTNMLVFKPVIDVLYLLSGKYEHMHIVRPFVSENADSRFVIFAGLSSSQHTTMTNLIESANNVSTLAPNQIISSVIDCKMSHYFTTKIEECNMLIGQKYVEKHDSLVTLIKNYANDCRTDHTKNISISRCIGWCEKHDIPIQSL